MNPDILFSIHVTAPGLVAALVVVVAAAWLAWKLIQIGIRYWMQEKLHAAYKAGVKDTRVRYETDRQYGK
jgi:peptidoglycan/LPS O-acetylase OafA/YrhL